MIKQINMSLSSIKTITVIGSGLMGHGIAQVSSMAGYEVTLRDIEQSFLDKAIARIKWSLDKLIEKKKLNQSEADAILKRINPVVDLETSLKNSDLIIEAVPEDMNLKKKLFSEVQKFSKPDAILASNTSTLPITEMSSYTNNPSHFIGIHFFNPPQLMKLVEVIPGGDTSVLITELILDFVKSLGKEPILCRKDVAGFIVNRIFIPLVHEAIYFRERENLTLEEVDSATRHKMGLPMGIFELADYTGIDVVHKATIEMHSRDDRVINPHPNIQKMYDNHLLGQKSGEGFYKYGQENYHRISLSEKDSDKVDIIKLIAVAINNACWLLSNNVCTKEELEKALLLGMGFKQELFKTGESYGFNNIYKILQQLTEQYGRFYQPDKLLNDL